MIAQAAVLLGDSHGWDQKKAAGTLGAACSLYSNSKVLVGQEQS
jgi:hypothetical protein